MADVIEEDGDQQSTLCLARTGVDMVQEIVRRVMEMLVLIRRSPGLSVSFAEQRSALPNQLTEITMLFGRLRKLQSVLDVRSAGLPSVHVNDVLKPAETALGDYSVDSKIWPTTDSDHRKRLDAAGWLIAERENLLQQIDVRNQQLRTAIQQLRELLTTLDTVLPSNIAE